MLHKIDWYRVILDEGHEYFQYNRRSAILDTRREICRLQSNYRWLCTGTPLSYYLDSWIVFDYLYPELFADKSSDRIENAINQQQCVLSREYQYRWILRPLIDSLYQRHTHQSVEQMKVDIPQPIIRTEFLDFSEVERNFYDSLADRGKKLQLCTHLQNLQDHLSVLGVKPLSLGEIHTKMTRYYQERLDKLTKRVSRLENDRTKVEGYLAEMEQQYEMEEKDGKGEERGVELVDGAKKKRKLEKTQNGNSREKKAELKASRQKRICEINDKIKECQPKINTIQSKLIIFQGLDEKLRETENCPVCWEDLNSVTKSITPCGHFVCWRCLNTISEGKSSLECPMCRFSFERTEIQQIRDEEKSPVGKGRGDDEVEGGEGDSCDIDLKEEALIEKWGTKFARMLRLVSEVLQQDPEHRIIIFSQWDKTLTMIQKALSSINVDNVIIQGQIYTIQSRIQRFRTDPSCRVVLISSSKNASGVNLTEASHVLLLDSLNTTREEARGLEEQAIGRAVRLGQKRRVEVRRLIIRNSIEHDFYLRNIGVPRYTNIQPAVMTEDGEFVDVEEVEEEDSGVGNSGGVGDSGVGDGIGEVGVTDANHEPSPMVI